MDLPPSSLVGYASGIKHFLTHPDQQVQQTAQQYAQGAFLMDNGDGLAWYSTSQRAIVPLTAAEGLHVARRLQRELGRFEVQINQSFAQVVQGCRGQLAGAPVRDGEWISDELAALYLHLHQHGLAHSFEVWQNGALAGGVLGLALGGAFIAESKFHRVSNASKVALVQLAAHLHQRGYTLLDAQVQNEHIQRLGVYTIPATEYALRLQQALQLECTFTASLN